jgi:hypothetical protein
MEVFFDLLNQKGLVKRGKINREATDKLSRLDLMKYAAEITTRISTKKIEKELGHSHFATSNLAGGRTDCFVLDCRMKRIDQLARFAILYSDRVYIGNYFSAYLTDNSIDLEGLRTSFFNDLMILLYIKPLIENGNIVIAPNEFHLCKNCYMEAIHLKTKINKLIKKLSLDYFNKTNIEMIKINDSIYEYDCECELLDKHGTFILERELPEEIKRSKKLCEVLEQKGRVKIPKIIQRKLNIHKDFAEEVAYNVDYGLACGKCFGASFLTNDQMHLKFLSLLSNNKETENRNKIAYDTLTTTVPFLEDVSLINLVKLRNREFESLRIFRKALNEAILSFYDSKKSITKNIANEIYNDVIAPKLIGMDKKVKIAKKDLVDDFRRTTLSLVGVISFGVLSGFINKELIGIATAVGIPTLAKALKKLMDVGDSEKAIRQDDFYFLWKTKQIKN